MSIQTVTNFKDRWLPQIEAAQRQEDLQMQENCTDETHKQMIGFLRCPFCGDKLHV